MTRAVIVLRLSKDSTSSSSIERQRAWCTEECERRGWVVVGEATDVDVSGGVDPFHRPALGPWLATPHRYDALVSQKMDRLTRDLGDQVLLGRWADKHGILIVAEGEELDSMASRVKAMVAEGELKRSSDRNKEAFDRNIARGNYRGGQIPFGYRTVKIGNEWKYEPDPEQTDVVRDVVARILSGDSVTSVVHSLNARSIPTTQDAQRLRTGKGYRVDPVTGEPRPARWTTANLIKTLRSETLLGYAMRSDRIERNGKPVVTLGKRGQKRKTYTERHVILDETGSPVQRAPGIITPDEFGRLQAALSVRRGSSPKRRVRGAALLLRVLFCGSPTECGRPMYAYYTNRGARAYYRCSSMLTEDRCGNRSAKLAETDEFVSGALLSLVGDYPNVRRQYVAGSDHTDQIAEIERQLDAMMKAVTRFTGSQLDTLLDRVDRLTETKQRLEAEPRVEPGYRYEPTSVMFRDFWTSLEPAERNQWLRDHNVRLTYRRMAGEKNSAMHLEFGDFPAVLAAVDAGFAAVLDKHGDMRRTLDQELPRLRAGELPTEGGVTLSLHLNQP